MLECVHVKKATQSFGHKHVFLLYTMTFAVQLCSSFYSQHKHLVGSIGCSAISYQCELSALFNIQFTLSLSCFFLFGDFGVKAGSDLHCAWCLALLGFFPHFSTKYK